MPEALRQRGDLAAQLEPSDLAYLAACRAADTARRNREIEEARKLATAERKAASRTRIGLVAASILALLAIGAFAAALVAAKNASNRAMEAIRNETVGLAALSATARGEGRSVDAIKLALAAWPRMGDDGRPQLGLTLKSLGAAIWKVANGVEIIQIKGDEYFVTDVAFSPDGTRVVTSYGRFSCSSF